MSGMEYGMPGLPVSPFVRDAPDLREYLELGQGLLVETYDRALGAGGNGFNGFVVAGAITLKAGWQVKGVISHISTLGSNTDARYVLYDKDYNNVAMTANIATVFNTTGIKAVDFPAQYSPPVTGLYYIAIWAVGGAGPSMVGCAGSTLAATQEAIGSGARRNLVKATGATPIARLDTPAANAWTPWMACYA